MTSHAFKLEAEAFFMALQKRLAQNQISLQSHWDIDHICYRVDTLDEYSIRKTEISNFSDLLIESEVNGRPICTFELHTPLQFLDRQIDLVELPAPKPGRAKPHGFEHIEIVCDRTARELQGLFPSARFDGKGLSKDFNAELELELDGLAIKFHHVSLKSVVTLEGNEKVFSALTQSKVLEKLRLFSPLVAGTFPLGISVKKSDIDILVSHANLDLLASEMTSAGFEVESHEDFVISRFQHAGIAFEIYGSTIESVRQPAYLHFQIEERLLKLFGHPLRDRILGLRAEGMKTEPAFAKAFGLKGDPYEELIRLHSWSAEQLKTLELQ